MEPIQSLRVEEASQASYVVLRCLSSSVSAIAIGQLEVKSQKVDL